MKINYTKIVFFLTMVFLLGCNQDDDSSSTKTTEIKIVNTSEVEYRNVWIVEEDVVYDIENLSPGESTAFITVVDNNGQIEGVMSLECDLGTTTGAEISLWRHDISPNIEKLTIKVNVQQNDLHVDFIEE